MLASLLKRQLHHNGIELSIPAMIEVLSAIREVAITYPPAPDGQPQIPQLTISKMTADQQRLFDILNLHRYLDVIS